MSLQTVKLTAERMREHASRHGVTEYTIILHGGEPLLAGLSFIDAAASVLREALPSKVKLDLHVQTNGLLLDDAALRVLERHRIRVGVSLDGGAAHNRRRVDAVGRQSHSKVGAALWRLAEYPEIYSGILATVDLSNPPTDVYHELLEFRPPRVDFLLPHGTWDNPPAGRTADPEQTPYADWLIEIFDLWYGAAPPPTKVRLFESVLSLLLGGASYTEVLGLHPIDLVTVETDGSYEQGDVLKIVGSGAAATGLHVRTHSFDDLMQSPGIRARRQGLGGLGPLCRGCKLVDVCGGGHYPHRFRDGSFLNPSVYCADLSKLILHAHGRMLADLRPVRVAEPVWTE